MPTMLGVSLFALNARFYSWLPREVTSKLLPEAYRPRTWAYYDGSRAVELDLTDAYRTFYGHIWDLKTGTWQVAPIGWSIKNRLLEVELSPHGHWLADAVVTHGPPGSESFVRVCDLRGGRGSRLQIKPRHSFRNQADSFCLRFSPDEKTLFLAHSQGLDQFNLATGKRLPSPWNRNPSFTSDRSNSIWHAATITPDTRFYIRRDDLLISVWEIPRGRLVRRFPLMPRPTNTIRRAFFSHNARFLFLKDIKPPFGPHEYCRFHCYDTLTGRNVWNAFGTRPSFFSNDEQELYLYHGTSFEVRDVASGAILRNLPAKTGINEAWLSMNGTTLISVRLNYVQSPTRYFRQRAR